MGWGGGGLGTQSNGNNLGFGLVTKNVRHKRFTCGIPTHSNEMHDTFYSIFNVKLHLHSTFQFNLGSDEGSSSTQMDK